MGKNWLFNLGAILLFTGACGQRGYHEMLDTLYSYSVPLINSDEVVQHTEQNQNLILLDTRSEEEFKISHIDGARFVDYDSFDTSKVTDIDRQSEIIVYCSVGYRSERIGEQLIEMGFTDVKNIYGGIFDWKNTDHPVVNMKGQQTDSVHAYNRLWSQWLTKGIKIYE